MWISRHPVFQAGTPSTSECPPSFCKAHQPVSELAATGRGYTFNVLLKHQANALLFQAYLSPWLMRETSACLCSDPSALSFSGTFQYFVQFPFADSNPLTDHGRNKLPERTTVKLEQWQQIWPEPTWCRSRYSFLFFFNLFDFTAQLQDEPVHTIRAASLTPLVSDSKKT